MQNALVVILILISSVSLGVGLFLLLKPFLTIDIQKKFYEKINWRIEPISMPKEVRNTKIMGVFLIAISAITIIYMLISIFNHA